MAGVAWYYRLGLILSITPHVMEFRYPVCPNQVVEWDQGPTEQIISASERPPNIILILADDMGFNDVSFFNGGAGDGSLQTPNIDSIAHDGVVFQNGYAANAVCAPSRASIMTGRYSTRFGFEFTPFPKIGITIGQLARSSNPQPLKPVFHSDRLKELPNMQYLGMPSEEITIAELLQEAGYFNAHIGKWHLGAKGNMRPEKQGFDNSLYMAGAAYLPEDSPEVVNARIPESSIDRMVWTMARHAVKYNGGHSFEPNGYLTDYYTDEAISVIEANRHRPFFLYLAHWGIHNPLQAKKSDYDALSHIKDHRLRVYSAMITALDRGVGRILATLDKLGLTENTLVVFTSDNGGAGYIGLSKINKPYRGWKLSHFEGGTHVPFFAKWPARIAPGAIFTAPVSHIDLFSTIVAAADGALPTDRAIDGVDLIPYVRGEHQGVPHRTLFWRQGFLQTVLHKNWKLIRSNKPDKHWLFNLRTDSTEQESLAAHNPDKVAQLEALLDEHNAVQAKPLWPSVVEVPVLIDKTGGETYAEGDEYAYWPN